MEDNNGDLRVLAANESWSMEISFYPNIMLSKGIDHSKTRVTGKHTYFYVYFTEVAKSSDSRRVKIVLSEAMPLPLVLRRNKDAPTKGKTCVQN